MTSHPRRLLFEDSKLRDVYIRELYWMASQVVKHADALFAATPVDFESAYISAEVDKLDLVYSALSYAAKIQELLYPRGRARTPEAIARSDYLCAMLGALSLSEIKNKKVRNTVEHFGEYLDQENLRHSEVKLPIRYGIMMNCIVSQWVPAVIAGVPFRLYHTLFSELSIPIYPVRVYVAGERRFYNMEWSVDLAALRAESQEIMTALGPSIAEEDPTQWVTALIIC